MYSDRTKIILVDDNMATLTQCKNFLKDYYMVHTIQSVTTLFEHLESNNIPDLILLDIAMPEMDGFDTIKKLKTDIRFENIPVIFLTSKNDLESERKGFNLGAVDYVTKPISPVLLQMRIQNQLKTRDHMRQLVVKEIAEKSHQIRMNFFMRMSHEMLTPMNAIMGMTEILKIPGGSIDKKECLDEIESASRQLLVFINNLLDISGQNENSFIIKNLPFSFNAMLEYILSRTNREVSDKQQKFSYDTDPLLPMSLIGDEKRLAQVIIHLLSNAIKFTPEKGEIHLSFRVIENNNGIITLQIAITDTGIGISKTHQTEIFDIFHQADMSVARKYSGAGLGLAMSKFIIELMGGDIWVESEPDKGSKFIFTCKLQNG